MKKYLFKSGAWQGGLATSAASGVTYASDGMHIAANGYFTVPYANAGLTIYIKYKFTATGYYNSISTAAALTAGYNSTADKIQISGAETFGTGLNRNYICGISSGSVISGAFNAITVISEIWVE